MDEGTAACDLDQMRATRHDLEVVVRSNFRAALLCAQALKQIQQGRLWVMDYKSWRAYVDETFPFTGRHADRLMKVDNIAGTLPAPKHKKRGEAAKPEPTQPAPRRRHVSARWQLLIGAQQQFQELLRDISTTRTKLKRLMDDPAAAYLRFQAVSIPLRDAEIALKAAVPRGPCGYCHAGKVEACTACKPSGAKKNLGWLSAVLYGGQPKELKLEWRDAT